MRKILFLTNGKSDMVEAKKYNECVYAYPIYKYNSKLWKAFTKIIIKIHFDNLLKYFLGNWASHVNEYGIIICEGLKGKRWIFEFLLKTKEKDTKIIMWHWNKIYKKEIDPNENIAKKCEQWSFDPDDCKKYNLKYNTQYFYKKDIDENLEKAWDIYFLGTDKNRALKILNLEKNFKDMGLKTNFHIVKSHLQPENSDIMYKKSITYKENLKNIIKSEIIIDIPISGQRGLTLRPLEALYYRKKLVSFNTELKKQSFYNENNILILDEKDLESKNIKEKIKEFIGKPYCETKENEIARNFFSFEEWMIRFTK